MIRYFCPSCWHALQGDEEVCPFCGYHLAEFASLSYEQKLLRALENPIPEQRLLAIQLLGNMGSQAAIPGLEHILETEKTDIFALSEALNALSKIPGPQSRQVIEKTRRHEFPTIRRLAEKLSKKNNSD